MADVDLSSALRMLPQQSRRDFLRIAAIAGVRLGLPASAFALAACEDVIEAIANRPVRRDVHTLAADDPVLVTYADAITAMKALPSSDARNWTRMAEIHLDHCPHGNWLFLPWHRAYLHAFEEVCRELTGDEDFALPYWNWTDNPQMPATFLDPGSPLNDPTRSATASSTASPSVVGATVINNILAEANFLNFASGAIDAADDQRDFAGYDPLEGTPHNSMHGFVGGNMGGFMSPLDPIFWTHHNRIDHLWTRWNLTLGNANTNDPAWVDREFTEFPDRLGNAQSISVLATILMPIFSYRYDVL